MHDKTGVMRLKTEFDFMHDIHVKQNFVGFVVAILCVALLMMLGGCASKSAEDMNEHKDETLEPVKFDVQIVKTDTGEDAFSISMEDFIESYNSFYAKDNGEGYLGDVDEWQMFASGPTFHNANETTCYTYSEDLSVRAIPQMKIYADSPNSGIYQISLAYDDHSYSIETYDMYEEMCFYAMRTLFPDESDKEIKNRCELMMKAVDESFTLDKQEAEEMPELTYQYNGVGMYPYYLVGKMMEIRIVPAES